MQFKKVRRATTALLILGISTTAIGIDFAAAKPPKPSKKEIKAAKAEEAAKADAKLAAQAKLAALGLTGEEVSAITE